MHTNPHEPQHRERFVNLAETRGQTERENLNDPGAETTGAPARQDVSTTPDTAEKRGDNDAEHGTENEQPTTARTDAKLMDQLSDENRRIM